MDQSKLAGVGNCYPERRGSIELGLTFGTWLSFQSQQRMCCFRSTIVMMKLTPPRCSRSVGIHLQCYGREHCARGKPVHKETNGPSRTNHFGIRTNNCSCHDLSVLRLFYSIQQAGTSDRHYPFYSDHGDREISASELVSSLTETSWKDALSEAP
jgi:hypothetical protein